ncbi:class I SAM-dependent methyltransferase [Dermatobacter hominis]|uniref:class I SAM-dependent methyltransferase n=1 Tax=Dermatobacter hominis TaxID=2884263 RepID=UPI001D10A395|nr:methyltransferase domain-containing protein [Dermatobacter hominis]UDY34774.1 methyltransferase domain-containing protein [Dermatobacter hominis]
MGVYEDRVLPRLVDLTCGAKGMERYRARAIEGLHGEVVEIGFGTGLNVPLYPAAVTKVWAVEPSLRSRELARERIDASTVPVEHVGLDGQRLPLPDRSCDAGLSTFTLCTIPDPMLALAELRRVLKPGATLHVLEHGAAPDPGVARWQVRIEPWQRRFAGGCHLTRDAGEMLAEAGFTDVDITARYVKGPKPWCYFSYGTATNPPTDPAPEEEHE